MSASVSRSLRVVAVTGAAALLAAGCASSQHAGAPKAASTDAATPHQAILLAAHQARLATSFSADLTMTTTGATSTTISGTLSARTRPTVLAEATLPTVDVDGQSVPGGIDEILTAKAIYMKMSELSKAIGKAWLEMPFSELDTASGADFGAIFQQIQNESPLQQTQELAGATDVGDLGATTIGGTAVTEYSGTISVKAALAQLPASARAGFQQDDAKAGVTSTAFTIWVDGQHQVRKLTITDHGTQTTVVMSELITSINQPVSVQFPAASQVATVPASALGSGR
jgi:hypothetical protein